MKMCKSLFNEVVGLQGCCKTYLLNSHLRFYFSLEKPKKNLKNSINDVLLKNVKYVHRGIFRTKSNIYNGVFLQK